jgi:hypothetical protein
MKGLSTIVATLLLLQSLGLSAPCMCDVLEAVSVAPSAEAALETTGHGCCHSASETRAARRAVADDSTSTDLATADPGELRQRCGDACGCDAALDVVTEAKGLASLSVEQSSKTPRLPTAFASLHRLPRVETDRFNGHDVDPPFIAIATPRRLAVLQRWRC